MSEESKAMVRRLLEAINTGNMDFVDELFAPELAEQAKQGFTAFRSAFPTGARRSWRWSQKGRRWWAALSARGHTEGR